MQFQHDFFCNPPKVPTPTGTAGSSRLNQPGNHDDAEKLATHSRWEDYGPELRVVWQSFWTAVTGD